MDQTSRDNKMNYVIHTNKSFLQTRSEIGKEMQLWGIEDWEASQFNNGAKLSYILRGKTIDLFMDKQDRPADNLRILYYAVHAMRMNEVRGMSDVFESAYLQLASPVVDKDPYDVLGLPRGTAFSVCEAQFRELAKQYHPDNANSGSTAKFEEVSKAIEQIRGKNK